MTVQETEVWVNARWDDLERIRTALGRLGHLVEEADPKAMSGEDRGKYRTYYRLALTTRT